jgi:hypothetical protein
MMVKSIQKLYKLIGLTRVMLLGLCAISLSACQPKAPLQGDGNDGKMQEAGEQDKIRMDTLLKIQIDTIVSNINKSLRDAGIPPNKIPYPIHNQEDTIYYWLNPDYSGRVSLEMEPEDIVDWPLYYIYNKEIIMVRYRYFSNVPGNRKAYESFIYLDKGEIVYCEDRGRDMAEGEAPYVIRQLTHSPSTRTVEEIKADYIGTWDKILPLLKADSPIANEIFK